MFPELHGLWDSLGCGWVRPAPSPHLQKTEDVLGGEGGAYRKQRLQSPAEVRKALEAEEGLLQVSGRGWLWPEKMETHPVC